MSGPVAGWGQRLVLHTNLYEFESRLCPLKLALLLRRQGAGRFFVLHIGPLVIEGSTLVLHTKRDGAVPSRSTMFLSPSMGGFVTESIKVKVKPEAWDRFCKETNYTGLNRNSGSGIRELHQITPQGFCELDFPCCYVWDPKDLEFI